MAEAFRKFNLPFESLADVEKFEQTPIEEWVPYKNVYDAFCAVVEQYGDKPSLIALPPGDPMGEGKVISYRDLLAKVNQTANLFLSAGLQKGETVTYLIPLCPQAYFTMLGAETVGTVNAVNPLLEPEHILGIAEAANATILIATGQALSPELWAKAAYVIDRMPNLKAVYVLGGGAECDGKKIFPLDDMIAKQDASAINGPRNEQLDDVVGYYHTGGTTGVPKLAPHTNRMQLSQVASSGFGLGYSSKDCLLAGLPMFHISGSIVVGLVPILNGVTLVIVSPQGFRDPLVVGSYWRLVEKYGVTVLGGVPTMLSALLNIPVGDTDISSLRAGLTGGSAAPVEVLKAISKQAGVPMLEGYGMTEVTCFTTMQPQDGEVRFGSVGLRFPYVDVKSAHIDETGKITRFSDPDEIGEIIMKGICVMPGYVQTAYNQKAFTTDGWLRSGDLGRIDKDGYVWLTGRAKDVIIRGGHNIDPSIVEEALHEHPAVELAAAVGRPDSYAGEIPVAYVQLKPGAKATPDELKDFALERIPERAANPADLTIIDAMPLTGVGKIFKPALRHDAAVKVFDADLAPFRVNGVDISVSVDNHPVHGSVAEITVTGGDKEVLGQQIADKLGSYTLRHEVIWQN
ncbi:acyl-CoA synthetase [Sneathiella chungangensis]|uniref:Acyl-CoA synthetase n=1 Tax=Sneathiella chungangensis TaxID=1418234 RepID=A0A845MIE0_9PROT|nr:acyl-CoA synthetase [Sneathiella chungangensis]MZR23435.1 acyl-CoA synthetase [Sneathiella chungangensis]